MKNVKISWGLTKAATASGSEASGGYSSISGGGGGRLGEQQLFLPLTEEYSPEIVFA